MSEGKFQSNPRKRKARQKLLGYFGTKQRGDMVPHEEIEKVTGFTREQNQRDYYDIIQWARNKHEVERGISIWPETMIGYYLCDLAQQQDLMRIRTKRSRRQLTKGINHVDRMPDEELNDHQRRVKDASLEVARNHLHQADYLRRQHEYMARSRPGDPLRIRRFDDANEHEQDIA